MLEVGVTHLQPVTYEVPCEEDLGVEADSKLDLLHAVCFHVLTCNYPCSDLHEYNPKASIATVGVKRPNFGTAGRRIPVYTNFFETTIPQDAIHHYDGMNFNCSHHIRVCSDALGCIYSVGK